MSCAFSVTTFSVTSSSWKAVLILLLMTSLSPYRTSALAGQRAANAEVIGPFIIDYGTDSNRREEILAEVRGFIWDHLQTRRPGQVTIIFGNLEGDPTEHRLSIQSGTKKADWVVRDQVRTTQVALLKPGEKPIRKTHLDKFCAFERIEKNTQAPIRGTEQRPPQYFRLRLTNCKTGAVWTF